VGIQEVIGDYHPFKCGSCKANTAHRLLKTYDCPDIPEAPGEVWLIECQRCFEQRIIYPTERLAAKEDDVHRCEQCGNYKMKASKCRICRIAAGLENIQVKMFNGHKDWMQDADL
jgi:hypothetical protein